MSDGFLSWRELKTLPPQEWLIQGLLPVSSQALLFGPPGQGKSFVALDWALSIATGAPWVGKYPVKRGVVLYIACEGATGIPKRVAAWLQEHGIEDDQLEHVLFRLKALDVYDPYAVAQFFEDFERAFPSEPYRDPRTGEVVETIGTHEELRLVVVDTLARTFRGKSENDSTEMTDFLRKLDAVTQDHNATLLWVHHSAKAGGERGSTALRGEMDAVFACKGRHAEVPVNGECVTILSELELVNDKQKDDVQGTVHLAVRRVPVYDLPPDEEGRPQTSLVLDLAPPKPKEGPKRTAADRPMRAGDMLRLLVGTEDGLTYKEWMLAAGMTKTDFNNRLKTLKAEGRVQKNTGTGRWTPATPDEEEDETD